MIQFFRRYSDLLLIFFLVGLFFLLSLPHLDEPGPYYDETYDAALVVDRFFLNEPLIPIATLPFFGLKLPWTTNGFTGILKGVLLLPVFLIFEPSVFAMRFTMLAGGVVNIVLTYYFARIFLSRFPAFVVLLLLVLDPNFVFETRLDWGPSVLSYFFRVAGSFFLIKGWIEEDGKKLKTGLLCFLLGVYNKITFHIFLIPLAVTLVSFFLKDVRSILKGHLISKRFLFICLAVMGVVSLYFFSNIPFGTLPQFSMGRRAQLFVKFLKGILPARTILGAQRGAVGETFFWVLLFVTFLLGWSYPFLRHIRKDLRRNMGVLTVFLSSMLSLLFLLQGVRYGCHFFLLYPFLHLTIGFLIQGFLKEAHGGSSRKRRRIATGVLAFYLVLTFSAAGSGLSVIQKTTLSFVRTGGRGFWSDAIYDLADYLSEKESKKVVCLDWGFQRNLLVLTKGKMQFPEPFWPWVLEGKDPTEDLRSLFSEKGNLYLLHEAPYEKLVKEAQVKIWAREAGFNLELVKTFYQKTGEVVFSVYVASPLISPP